MHEIITMIPHCTVDFNTWNTFIFSKTLNCESCVLMFAMTVPVGSKPNWDFSTPQFRSDSGPVNLSDSDLLICQYVVCFSFSYVILIPNCQFDPVCQLFVFPLGKSYELHLLFCPSVLPKCHLY